MKRYISAGVLGICAMAAGQTASRPVVPAPSALPRSLEVALPSPLALDVEAAELQAVSRMLPDMTGTNVAFNWNALAASGITRETPVTLHLKNVSYETVVRTLAEVLPTTGGAEGRANYAVAENTLEFTTNRELGKGNEPKLHDIRRAAGYTFNATLSTAEQEQNAKLVEAIIRAELARAGEPLGIKGHELATRGTTLAATISDRGQTVVERALGMLGQPARVGQVSPGILMTAAGKRAETALKAVVAKMSMRYVGEQYVILAREPGKYADQLNVALLPGTAAELAKAAPEIEGTISEGGVVLVGPREVVAKRTVMGVFDLREVMKKVAAKSTKKPTMAECQSAIVQLLQTEIKAGEADGKWGGAADLGKKAAIMVPYNGVLVVFATQDEQRMVAGALVDMNK